jgi:allophanate hydrolase
MSLHSLARPEQAQTAAQPGCAPQAWILKLDTPQQEGKQGPLAGLSFAVKDNIDVQGLPTTAGCPAFAYTPDKSATVVHRLLDAGAALAGKTNLDQFACGLNGTRSPYGAVPNALNPLYISGGSSSGSAYVVATGQVDFALGTDTAGSGRVPAGLNNIVGLKPSRGLISTRGVLPAAQSVDAVSIFARTVQTAWQVLLCAQGLDAADPYSRQVPFDARPFPARFRFGVPSPLEFFGQEGAKTAFEEAVETLRSLGGTPVAIDYGPLAQAADLLYGSALVAERYTAIREFFDRHAQQVIEPVRSIIEAGRQYQAADVFEARTRLQALAQQVAPMWAKIDLLLVPTAPAHYTITQMQADPVRLNRNLGYYTNFVNLLDYAALSVPSRIDSDGLAHGITLIGPCGSDWRLAQLGARYHASTGLTLGAGTQRIGPDAAIPTPPIEPSVCVAVVGAHLSGMPLNGQLTERGAQRQCVTRTAKCYRLFALPESSPPKPGLLRVAPDQGHAIEVEVWRMPVSAYGSFVALIPPPLGIGTLELEDGQQVQGFVCEPQALAAAQDISAFGGWRAYINKQQQAPV